jgi:hypothetical protein
MKTNEITGALVRMLNMGFVRNPMRDAQLGRRAARAQGWTFAR